MSDPVIRAAGRAARPPVAGQVQPGSALVGGRAIHAHRAAVANVEIGVSAFRSGQPEVIHNVAKSGGIEGELPEHRAVVPAPIVDDIVPKIEHVRMLHQRGPRAQVRVQVVMERNVLGRTGTSDMLAHETLANDVPLEGRSIQIGAVPIQLRVGTPGDGAVVHDHVADAAFRGSVEQNVVAGIVLHVAAHAHAQVAQNDVMGAVDAPNTPVAVRWPGSLDLRAAR